MQENNTKKKGGPPNNVNDLTYTEWMKFQKSFFWHISFNQLNYEFIRFFTKEYPSDNVPSKSLIIEFDDNKSNAFYESEKNNSFNLGNRMINEYSLVKERFSDKLDEIVQSHTTFDFILINALNFTLSDVQKYLVPVFPKLKLLINHQKYITFIVSSEDFTSRTYPLPWLFSYLGRKFFKLRDEKIGFLKGKDLHYYSIIFQNSEESSAYEYYNLFDINVSKADLPIPLYLFPKSPPRKKDEILHPAKFPESLIESFINIFSKEGDIIFDPMVGTGSTVIAAIKNKRVGFGSDLSQDFINISKNRINLYFPLELFEDNESHTNNLFQCDATKLSENEFFKPLKIKYCITSPPYWSMLRSKGSEYQRQRKQKGLPLFYSTSEQDVGNELDYNFFVQTLTRIYDCIGGNIKNDGYLTIIVKNVKKDQKIYPLAWDLVASLSKPDGQYDFIGYTLWCQDDIPIRPFALGAHWISHTVHNYCLHFRKRSLKKAHKKT